MASKKDIEDATRERNARERGRTIPHYAGKVAKNLTTPRKRGKSTPPKKD